MFRIIGFLLLGMLSATSAWAAPGDAAVLQAQQAFAARKLANLERAARDVPADHALSPYVEYWRLMLTSRTEDARIAEAMEAVQLSGLRVIMPPTAEIVPSSPSLRRNLLLGFAAGLVLAFGSILFLEFRAASDAAERAMPGEGGEA